MKGTLTLRKSVEPSQLTSSALIVGSAGKSISQSPDSKRRLLVGSKDRRFDETLTDARGRKIICRKSQIPRYRKNGAGK